MLRYTLRTVTSLGNAYPARVSSHQRFLSSSDITIDELPEPRRMIVPSDDKLSKVVFGTVPTDHMFIMEYNTKQGWHAPRVEPHRALVLDPACLVFHYGQAVFEGMKAYTTIKGKKVLFRPLEHLTRFTRSCARVCIPQIQPDFMLEALKILLHVDRNWIPTAPKTALYIRPAIIATEAVLGVKVSTRYTCFIVCTPVGPYYASGFNPVKILVNETYTRAAPNGLGEAKTAANYAAALKAEYEAKAAGFTQVLWLDAVERKYVEEIGSMNVFFVINNEIVTPRLTGTILSGVTRQTVLEIAASKGYKVAEKRISIEDVVAAIDNGRLTEAFGSGTAAVISPIGELHYRDRRLHIGEGKTGPIAQMLFDEITGIHQGRVPDKFNYLVEIDT